MKEELINYLYEKEFLPTVEKFDYIDQIPTEEFVSREPNTLWLYKPFRVYKKYRARIIKDCINHQIDFLFNDMDFSPKKQALESWIEENENEAKKVIKSELLKQIKIYDDRSKDENRK